MFRGRDFASATTRAASPAPAGSSMHGAAPPASRPACSRLSDASRHPISAATSAFLDALRILSAAIVFASHCAQFWNARLSALLEPLAHASVVVFFVLSGYVVTYSTSSKLGNGAGHYAVARLSRLYSIVAPALALTALLAVVGAALAPAFHAQLARGFGALRYLLTALFLQNVWTFSASPPTNGPLWSLSYEFWYYVLFGCAVFVRPVRARAGALALVMLAAGPNILLLMPCWIVGAAICIGRPALDAALTRPRVALASGLVLVAASVLAMPPLPLPLGSSALRFSAAFLTDWVTALGVATVIAAFSASGMRSPAPWASAWLRRAGDLTFPLYLFHFPMIVFVTAAVPFDSRDAAQALPMAGAILASALVLGGLADRSRPAWHDGFERLRERAAQARARRTIR